MDQSKTPMSRPEQKVVAIIASGDLTIVF